MKSIVDFFAKEHLFGNLLTVLVLIFGTLSLFTIRRDIWPNVQFNITTVSTLLPGASPEQVEKLVINPMEEAIREVEGIKKVFSTATESQAISVLQLDDDARNPTLTNNDIKEAIDRMDDLPTEAEDPVVNIVEAGRNPVIEVTVSSDDLSDIEIRDAADVLADELSLMSLVSSVQKNGHRKKEFVVEADPAKLAARNVSLSQLIQSVQLNNVSIPAGTASTPGGGEVLVRTEAQVVKSTDLESQFVTANQAGFGSRIKDIATVSHKLEKPFRLFKAQGEPSINLVVAKKVNADALTLVQSVKDKVHSFKEVLGSQINLGFSNDFSVYLSNRLNALRWNLFIGLGLVILILTFFLPWQVTLVVAAGIPVALLASIMTAKVSGLSLNLISLIGLIIVLGMLVDDAIVVSENIWRHIEKGGHLMSSIVSGATEVLGPVTASILTTISAFAPMMFMTGIFGAFVFEIPLMVILSLLFSFLEVFLIMPSHFASWVGPFTDSAKIKSAKKNHWFDGVAVRYQKYVRWSLRFRYAMIAGAFALLAGTVGLLASTGRFILFPPEGVEIFFVIAEAPVGTPIEKMSELVEPIERAVAKVDSSEIKDFATAMGIIQMAPNDPQTKRGSHLAAIRVSLTPQNARERTANEIIEQLRGQVGLPNGLSKISFDRAKQGPPQGRPISINVMGADYDRLNKLADEVRKELESYDGVIDVSSSFVPGKPEWQVIPDPKALRTAGLTASQVATTVRASFEGIVASSVRDLSEETDIRIKLKQPEGSVFEQLKDLRVGNTIGNLIPLPQIATFSEKSSLNSISHYKFKRLINISADVNEDKTTALGVTSQIRPFVETLGKKYPGYELEFGGEDEDTRESMRALVTAFSFAAFVIFSLLIVTFRNLLQPIVILTSIPLGFIGVAYAMLIHGRPFSFMAMLGVIALAGVIVNNAIVFTDFVNKQRKAGHTNRESIVEAAGIRLRPIVLTTLTTVSGLLPTAYGDFIYKIFGVGGGDPFIVPIALSLGWGMAFGSVMTSLFFPSFLAVLDDVSTLPGRIKAMCFKKSPQLV